MPSHEVTYHQSGPDGEPLAVPAGIPEAHQQYQTAVQDYVRENAGVEMPATIPVAQINQYYHDMGRRTAPVVAIDSDNPRSIEALQGAGLSEAAAALRDPATNGIYSAKGDLSIVAVNRDRQVGSVNTTRTLAHEQGHSAEKTSYVVTVVDGAANITFAGAGYRRLEATADGTEQHVGLALTEAQAEMNATRFAQQQGLTRVQDPQLINGLYVPAEYCRVTDEGKMTYSLGASPAIAVELIAVKDPAIIGLVLDGAQSAAKEAELCERLQALDEEYPGVADALLGVYTDEGIEVVGKKVGTLLGASQQDIVDAHDNANEVLDRRARAQQAAQAQQDDQTAWSQPPPTRNRIEVQGDDTSTPEPASQTTTTQTAREGLGGDTVESVRATIYQAIGLLATASPSTVSCLTEAYDELEGAMNIVYAQLGSPGSDSFDRYAQELAPFIEALELFQPLQQKITVLARTAQTIADRQ